MKTIQLEEYYDVKTFSFKYPNAKADLEELLHDYVEDIMHVINVVFSKESNFMFETMNKIKVEADPRTLLPSKYIPSIKKIIETIESLEDDRYNDFFIKYKKGLNELELNDELRLILNNLKNSKSELRLKSLINSYLNKPCKPGMYLEDEHKVILFLKEIAKKEDASDYLLENFSHELFHGYHYLMANKNFHNSYKYTDYQEDAVKEGLAKYIEFKYLSCGKVQNKELVERNEFGMKDADMRDFPYAAYNILKGREELFKEIFYTSLKDMGEAYNLLLINSMNDD